MYWYCRPTVRLGWVGRGVTNEKGGSRKRGVSLILGPLKDGDVDVDAQ